MSNNFLTKMIGETRLEKVIRFLHDYLFTCISCLFFVWPLNEVMVLKLASRTGIYFKGS
jgi:hypothetical protein